MTNEKKSRTMPENTGRKRKVYGKKAGAKFSAPPVISSSPRAPQVEKAKAKSSEVAKNPVQVEQKALDDVTSAFQNIALGATIPVAVKKEKDSQPFAAKTPAIAKSDAIENIRPLTPVSPVSDATEDLRPSSPASSVSDATEDTTPSTTQAPTRVTYSDPSEEWLEPLLKAYEKQSGERITVEKWGEVFDSSWLLDKIAESSYAEVYKVSNDDGMSVLKIMALKPPTGPGSQRDTAVEVGSVISEVLIMDMMANIPGFLEFKAAHIIKGRPPKPIIDAYAYHADHHDTYFPNPKNYHTSQLWLVLELGDAGMDLENFEIATGAQLWDIFLGVVLALAEGEIDHRFEHRDLHEGNVCVKQIREPKDTKLSQTRKFGSSGLQVTLLDYTLSRAEIQDSEDRDVVYLNLEDDPTLFGASDYLQNETYRRMRSYMYCGVYKDMPYEEYDHIEHPWKDFMPYTNVLWIYYILDYILRNYQGSREDLDQFKNDIRELQAKLQSSDQHRNTGFQDAGEVLGFIFQKGWMVEADFNAWAQSWIPDSESESESVSSESSGSSEFSDPPPSYEKAIRATRR